MLSNPQLKLCVLNVAALALLTGGCDLPGYCETAPADSGSGAPAQSDDKPKEQAPTSSTAEAPTASTSETPAASTGTTPGDVPDKPVPVTPTKPTEPLPPKGYDAALQLYKSGKFAAAAAQFQKFIKDGVADTNTHFNLANSLYYQRQYTKAIKEFDWVAANGKGSISQRNGAGTTARTLRQYMAGICPGNCLKAKDPRWHHDASIKNYPATYVWINFPYKDGSGSSYNWSQNHIGDDIEYVKGVPTDTGKCKICGGATRVEPLKDGDPIPGTAR